MKIFIASDIHGSAYYCKKMIEAFKKENADKILLLGDILYHGPRNDLPKEYNPKTVINLLNDIKDRILCVRGNCDTEVDQMVLNFPILADYCVIHDEFLTIYATHGHIYNKDNLPPMLKGDVLVSGHTHIPVCDCTDVYRFVNPGSVSIPKEESQNGYVIYENGVFIHKNLSGDVIELLNK